MKTIDARGLQCPRPIIETRKALKEAVEGDSFNVLIDNETSLGNLCKFLDDNGCTWQRKREDGYWSLIVFTDGSQQPDERIEEEYCVSSGSAVPAGNWVVALTSDSMGQGDETLGRRLITSFVNLLTELDNPPTSVLCYNSGVKLALPGSGVEETLAELEKRGVEVILCGTCIDFFGLREKTFAGKIGDMFLIAGRMASATSVIRP